MNEKTAGSAHWSFWVIGVGALVWHVLGSVNFAMQMNPSMVVEMPEAFRAVIESRPVWATAAFAVAVFGGVIGCILLLLKKSASTYLFVASLIGVLVQVIPFVGVPNVQLSIWIGSLMSFVVAGFLIWYSMHATRKP